MNNLNAMDNPTTFWLSKDSHTLRIIYVSYTSKEHSMVADIDMVAETCKKIYEENEKKEIIANFIGNKLNAPNYRQMHMTGCDLSIIRQAYEIIENKYNLNGKDKESPSYYLWLHVQCAIDYKYTYFDMVNENDPKNIKKILDLYYQNDFNVIKDGKCSRNNCYCGITNNLDRRMEEHRENDFEIAGNKVYAIVCHDKNVASKVENLMGYDYDIGNKAGMVQNKTLILSIY